MKILVTGAAGFIGAHVAKTVLERGDTVVGIDNFNSYYSPQLKRARVAALLGQNVAITECDLADQASVFACVQNYRPDVICHLAAQAGVRYSLECPEVYLQTNILGTHNVFEAAKRFDVKRVVYASSSSVYGGNEKIPFAEDDDVSRPLSMYALTKRTNEQQAYYYHRQFGLPSAGLRFFTVYGPWGRPDMSLFKFTKNILADAPIDVYNNGNHKRDFTFVDDIVSGVVAAIDRAHDCKIYNLGFGNPVNLEDFIIAIEQHLGKKAQRNYLPMQQGDVVATWADISRARAELDFAPKTPVAQGVERFIAWYMHHVDFLKNL